MEYKNKKLFLFALLVFLASAACDAAKATAGETIAANQTVANQTSVESSGSADSPSANSGEKNPAEIIPQAIAGSYRLNTYKADKGGQDNVLDVEDKGNGRLRVSISGSNVWYAGDVPQMHEGGGAGEAQLKGATAIAEIVPDGDDRACRVTIVFTADKAKLSVGEDCSFNVALDGVYTKERSKRPVRNNQTKSAPENLQKIDYSGLRDFVNDHETNKTGKRFLIDEVPANKISGIKPYELSDKSGRGLFYLQIDDSDSDVSTMFVASSALVKSLKANAGIEPTTLRATAVLVEFIGEFDIYRSSFITKIEGLDSDGKTIWTAEGTAPTKTRFQQ